MNKKELLDYLVSIGLGTKVVSSVRTNQPDFPNQDSIYYNKDTNFRTQQIKYTIEIPVMETDNTRVDVQVAYPGETTPAPRMKDKIFAFLVMLFGDPYTQNYGVTFYSPNFGNKHYEGSPYRAKHWGGYVNIDSLLPLMSAFGGIGEGLDMAWFLNYLKDILAAWGIGEKKKIGNLDLLSLVKAGAEAASMEYKYKKEDPKEQNKQTNKDTENIKTTNNKNGNSNVNNSTYQDPVFLKNDSIVDKIEFIVTIVEKEPSLRGTQQIKGVDIDFYSMPGDTLSRRKKTTYKSGRVEYESDMIYPSTTVDIKGNNRIVNDVYKNWRKK